MMNCGDTMDPLAFRALDKGHERRGCISKLLRIARGDAQSVD
jgi:hypothetical protein